MEKCQLCNKKATSIIRTMFTCSKCFSILSKDNKRLFKNNLNIPSDETYLKHCSYYPCEREFISKLKYENGEVVKEYCSDVCNKADNLKTQSI